MTQLSEVVLRRLKDAEDERDKFRQRVQLLERLIAELVAAAAAKDRVS